MRKQKGITLIALVITIIIMLILAGIVISLTIGENGIIRKAQESGIAYNEAEARQKLELVLLDMQADKVTNKAYNQDEYLTNKIEEKNMIVNGDIVFVDGWQFQIDRSIPKIVANLGKGEANQQIKLAVSQTVSSDYVKSMVKIEIEYEGEITYIQFGGEEIEVPEKKNGKYLLEKEVTVNGNYSVLVRDKEDKYQMATIKVSEITEDMDIWTKEDMELFRDLVNSGRTFSGRMIRQMADINLEGNSSNLWTPIDNFYGTYQGNNFKIQNMYITEEKETIGLFRNNKGVIQNINLESGEIRVNASLPIVTQIGGIVGINSGIVENSQSKIILQIINTNSDSKGLQVGGIVGSSTENSQIRNCSYKGDIKVSTNNIITSGYVFAPMVGGIAGVASEAQIIGCYNTANIYSIGTGNNNTVYGGGIVGYTQNSSIIESCYNKGNIKTRNEKVQNQTMVGGIVGHHYLNSTIKNCYNIGNISSDTKATIGGIAGNNGATITNTFFQKENVSTVNAISYQGEGVGVGTRSGVEKTNIEMKTEDFVSLLNNGTDMWKIDTNNSNNGYPILKWQME